MVVAAAPAGLSGRARRARDGAHWTIRRIPVGWRISLLVALNLAVMVTSGALIWQGGATLGQQWSELRRLTDEERLLDGIGSDFGRLQSLIHRSLTTPTADVLAEIGKRRAALLDRLTAAVAADPKTSRDVSLLTLTTRQFLGAFDALGDLNTGIHALYRDQVLKLAGEISGLFGILENAPRTGEARLWPMLGQARETFVDTLVSVDAFYFSGDQDALERARGGLGEIIHAGPAMRDMARAGLERSSVIALTERITALSRALERLGADLTSQTQLVNTDIDGAQARMSEIIDRLIAVGRQRQGEAQRHFDHGLWRAAGSVAVVGVAFVLISLLVGLIIARSIRQPIRELVWVMAAVAGGDYERPIPGTEVPDEIGAMARALAVFKDDALAKRRVEHELEAQERRWRTVLEASPLGISIIAADSLRRLYVNPRALQLIGVNNLGEALALPVEDSFTDLGLLTELAERARRSEGIYGIEIERRRPDGSLWWCALYVGQIEIDERHAFIVWQHDVTERRRHETELRAAKERAEAALADLGAAQQTLIQSEKMASLGGLVAGVAHEINTPLGISLTSASLMADESRRLCDLLGAGSLRKSDLTRFLELALESSELMLSNCQRAAELIKSFKQVAVDQTSDERRVFNLREYLDEILISLGPRFKRLPITIAVECPADLEIAGYPGPIAQVLTNFVMNSLIHGFDPGQPGRLSITATARTPDLVELVYTDDGKGIPGEVLPKIFDPFFTTNRSGGGSGLGLNIVYNLIHQRLRGQIEVTSAPGRGTTFTVRFPRVL